MWTGRPSCRRWLAWARCSGVVHKVHEIRIIVGAALERSSILNKEPEESRLHLLVSFANNMYLWNHMVVIVIIPQSVDDSSYARG